MAPKTRDAGESTRYGRLICAASMVSEPELIIARLGDYDFWHDTPSRKVAVCDLRRRPSELGFASASSAPSSLGAWLRKRLGWLEPLVVADGTEGADRLTPSCLHEFLPQQQTWICLHPSLRYCPVGKGGRGAANRDYASAFCPIMQKPLPNGSLQNAMGGRCPPSNFFSHFAPAFNTLTKAPSKSLTWKSM
jgi:hypothetical protein